MLTVRVWVGLGLFFIACAIVGFVVAPRGNVGLPDQASVLSLAAMAAVGIERLLELMWATLGSKLGGWWPLKSVTEQFAVVEQQTNGVLKGLIDQAQKDLVATKAQFGDDADKAKDVDSALAQITSAQGRFEQQLLAAQKLAPGSERMALLASAATSANAALSSVVGLSKDVSDKVQQGLTGAQQAIDVALTVAQSFSDNPARRIASILIGGSLGMIAAAFLGLNIFAAVLGPGLGPDGGYLYAGLGVILTGFVVGLGSSPTHEVVKALQNYKATRGTTVEADLSADPPGTNAIAVSRGAPQGLAPQSGNERIVLRGTQ